MGLIQRRRTGWDAQTADDISAAPSGMHAVASQGANVSWVGPRPNRAAAAGG
jgi:hypothetical protein